MANATVIPLARDASSRFLPWLIAFMVWLAALALAAVLVLSSFGDQWRNTLTGTLTVQIAAAPDDHKITTELRVQSALRIIRATPGIVSAKPVPLNQISDLLAPWLGRDLLTETLGLPIPRLIDVKLKQGVDFDVAALWERLNKEISGTQVDDHGVWLDKLIALASAIEAIAFAILILISVAGIATVVFATRTSLTIHRDVIELLHVMGARDEFVADQFHRHAMFLGLKGGVAGVALALITLWILGSLWQNVESSLLPPASLDFLQWTGIIAVALVAAAISTITARYTVLRALGRMP
ncbi:MAG: cell division protein [Rhodospirillaceae bacterium]|nr:cell division protein [Rhodospirillaceae bacterium]|tara:strand:- start:2690 stop:3580 length:891 start_codon:yes stop_codon:yes gene_type:complete